MAPLPPSHSMPRMSDDWADEVAEAPPTELAPVLPELPQIMLFGKWSCEDVSVSDMSLQDYIAVKEKYAQGAGPRPGLPVTDVCCTGQNEPWHPGYGEPSVRG